MDGKVIVNVEDLNKVSNDIINKKNEIIDVYEKELKNIIILSKDCLTQGGFSYETFQDDLSKLFIKLENEISNLTDTLKNDIIPKYENLSSDLNTLFNDDFKNQMSDLLEMHNDN